MAEARGVVSLGIKHQHLVINRDNKVMAVVKDFARVQRPDAHANPTTARSAMVDGAAMMVAYLKDSTVSWLSSDADEVLML